MAELRAGGCGSMEDGPLGLARVLRGFQDEMLPPDPKPN